MRFTRPGRLVRNRFTRWLLRRPSRPSPIVRPPLGENLARVVRDANVKVVDIGAREARGEATENLTLLAPYAGYYAFEPDADEVATIEEKLHEDLGWASATVIPKALGKSAGNQTLYLTKHLGMSSLLKPDRVVARRYGLESEFEVLEEREVITTSLGDAARENGFGDATFIKLDTQGTELDILKSGEELLRDSVVGVYVEVEFQPFYTGQPLFSDIDEYLRSLGFSLFDLDRLLTRRSDSWLDYYSRRQIVWAHALYLKEPHDLAIATQDSARERALSRLFSVALAFQHYDVCSELLEDDELSDSWLSGNRRSLCRSEFYDYVKLHTNQVDSYRGHMGSTDRTFPRQHKDRNYRYL